MNKNKTSTTQQPTERTSWPKAEREKKEATARSSTHHQPSALIRNTSNTEHTTTAAIVIQRNEPRHNQSPLSYTRTTTTSFSTNERTTTIRRPQPCMTASCRWRRPEHETDRQLERVKRGSDHNQRAYKLHTTGTSNRSNTHQTKRSKVNRKLLQYAQSTEQPANREKESVKPYRMTQQAIFSCGGS